MFGRVGAAIKREYAGLGNIAQRAVAGDRDHDAAGLERGGLAAEIFVGIEYGAAIHHFQLAALRGPVGAEEDADEIEVRLDAAEGAGRHAGNANRALARALDTAGKGGLDGQAGNFGNAGGVEVVLCRVGEQRGKAGMVRAEMDAREAGGGANLLGGTGGITRGQRDVSHAGA